MTRKMNSPVRQGLRPLLSAIPAAMAVALPALSGSAMAQTSPYYIGVRQAFTHDDNVYKAIDGGPLPVVADTVSSTGIVAGIDQPFGRQRFYANGEINANRHKNQDQLNNTSYGLATGLDWSTIERLSGNLRASARQDLANYGDANAAITPARNLQKSQQVGATVRYGLVTSIALEGGLEHGSIDFTAPDDQREVRNDTAHIGVRWGGGRALSFGLTARVGKAKYPNLQTAPGVVTPDELDRRDLEGSAVWTPTGLSTLTVRLAATREKHSITTLPDFSGVTGGAQWDYNLTGKLRFSASINHDTGTASTFSQFAPSPVALPTDQPTVPTTPLLPTTLQTIRVDTNRVSNTAVLSFNYEATAKIRLNGNVRRTSSTSGGAGNEDLGTYGLGVRYDPTRSITLGCNVGRESRQGAYSSNTVGCDAQLTLR